MRKVILFLIAFCVHSVWGQNHEWHVKPYVDNDINIPGNDGSTLQKAMCLQYALNGGGGSIHSGDIIWLHGGDYKGNFESTLSGEIIGSDTIYTRVESFPGEWARLNGNTHTYIAPQVNRPYETGIAGTLNKEIESYNPTDDEDPSDNIVLGVYGNLVHYNNFEITCLGNINRLAYETEFHENCNPTGGFHKMVGINNVGSTSVPTKNIFSNLVIRNIPGTGMGSWKDTSDSEVYGCLIYNNGYIRHQKVNCSNNTYEILGKGPGIYTQNRSNKNRRFENNIFHNNYDSGILVWSASTDSTTNPFIKNYLIKNNIFINNGGPQRDDTPAIVVNSQSSTNQPENININANSFYLNNRSNYISGLTVNNTKSIKIENNSFYKSIAFSRFYSTSKNIFFHNNFGFGKRIQIFSNATDYAANTWNFNNNTYYTMNLFEDMFQVTLGPPATLYSLSTFQSIYNDELDSQRDSMTGENDGTQYMHSPTLSPRINVTQNKYNPNIFTVSIFNPNPYYLPFDNITVDLSNFAIPDNRNYVIKNPENYFGSPIGSGIYDTTNSSITFPMTATASIELPTGYYLTTPLHSLKDFHAFILDFSCSNLAFDRYLSTTDATASTIIYDAKRDIVFNNYIAGNSSAINTVISTTAGRSIVIKESCIIYKGVDFHGKIDDSCPDLIYVPSSNKNTEPNSDNVKSKSTEHLKTTDLKIYPNPSFGIFNLESVNKINQVIIFNVDYSREVLNQKFINTSKTEINISKEPKGLYIVKVFFEDGSSETKTIIKK